MEAVELKLKQASAGAGRRPERSPKPRPVQGLAANSPRQHLLVRQSSSAGGEDRPVPEGHGTSTDVLRLFARALSSLSDEHVSKARYLSLRSRPAKGREPIEVRIPVRDLANELNEQLPTAAVYQDLPRGRKRSGWKREFTRTLEAAAKDLSGVTEAQIADAIRGFRSGKKTLPEIRAC